MNSEAVKTEEYRGFKIQFYQDECPESPREWDNLGTMVCFHKRYDLGDKHDIDAESFNGWDEMVSYLEKERDAAIVLPLYLYDHSGITMNTKGFSCPWDSGRIGFIFIDKTKVRKEYSVKHISPQLRQRVTGYLENEVKTYDQYLRGEVYGFTITDADGENLDSCWGYYGDEGIEDALKECKATIDHHITEQNAKKHYPKVEVFATKNMKFRARIRESVEVPSYEVTIGGQEWQKGKGKAFKQVIAEKAETIVSALIAEFEADWDAVAPEPKLATECPLRCACEVPNDDCIVSGEGKNYTECKYL
jgi:hypothetical protein